MVLETSRPGGESVQPYFYCVYWRRFPKRRRNFFTSSIKKILIAELLSLVCRVTTAAAKITSVLVISPQDQHQDNSLYSRPSSGLKMFQFTQYWCWGITLPSCLLQARLISGLPGGICGLRKRGSLV